MSSEETFLRFFFEELDAQGCDYAVIRNYASLPVTVEGTDIDLILFDRPAFRGVFERMKTRVSSVGYKVWKKYRKNYNIIQVVFVPDELDCGCSVVRVDFVLGNVKWLGRPVVHKATLHRHVDTVHGVRILKDPAKTALTVLNTVLYGGRIKTKYKGEYRALSAEQLLEIRALFSVAVGEPCAERLQRAMERDDDVVSAGEMRRAFFKAGWRVGLQWSAGIVQVLWVWMTRIFNPPGIFLVLIGPDGCGKSTVYEMIQSDLGRVFPGIGHFHFFPKLHMFSFLDKRAQARWEAKQKKASEWDLRSQHLPRWRSLLQCVYLNVRFSLGYFFWIYPRLIRGQLVVGERWNYDVMLDPASKSINLPRWIRLVFFHLVPRSCRTIALVGDPRVMAARKADLPAEEIARQIELIKREFSGIANMGFVDSTIGLDETKIQVFREIGR